MRDPATKLGNDRANPFEHYGAEILTEADARNGVVPSAAELQKIWSDPQRLLHWTVELLCLVGDYPDRSGVLARIGEDEQRRRLQRLAHDNPQRFVELLTRQPNLAKLARKRPRGRQPGQHAPGLAEAWETAQYIRQRWREVFKHTYRTTDPTAIGIAAAMYGFTPEQLQHYRTNRNRKRHLD
jgi:hypothetical protein